MFVPLSLVVTSLLLLLTMTLLANQQAYAVSLQSHEDPQLVRVRAKFAGDAGTQDTVDHVRTLERQARRQRAPEPGDYVAIRRCASDEVVRYESWQISE
jgi:hypothetical protein